MKIIWIYQCYEDVIENNRITNPVTVEVYAPNEKAALAKVKKLVKRPNYRLAQIIEK